PVRPMGGWRRRGGRARGTHRPLAVERDGGTHSPGLLPHAPAGREEGRLELGEFILGAVAEDRDAAVASEEGDAVAVELGGEDEAAALGGELGDAALAETAAGERGGLALIVVGVA